jgi:hypothetical protein
VLEDKSVAVAFYEPSDPEAIDLYVIVSHEINGVLNCDGTFLRLPRQAELD